MLYKTLKDGRYKKTSDRTSRKDDYDLSWNEHTTEQVNINIVEAGMLIGFVLRFLFSPSLNFFARERTVESGSKVPKVRFVEGGGGGRTVQMDLWRREQVTEQ